MFVVLTPMKFLLLVFVFTFSTIASGQTILEVRSSFHQAVMEPETSRDFHELMESPQENSATIVAYQAVSEALLAQVVWNPFSKLSQVMKYDKLMEKAVLEDEENIEIRFLRLAIEVNLPSFLGMSEHIKEDRDMIVNNMSKVSTMKVEKGYGQYIFYFLNETGLCTEEEISLMEEMLAMNGI